LSRRTIAITSVTFDALHSVAKYRETMDDVVLKAVVSYAHSIGVNEADNDSIAYAVSEYHRRFTEKGACVRLGEDKYEDKVPQEGDSKDA